MKATMWKTDVVIQVRRWAAAVAVFVFQAVKAASSLLIIVLVAGYYGVDLTGMLTGEPMPQQQTSTQRSISPKDDEAAKFTSVILATTEDTRGPIFLKKMGRQYVQPKLVMYRGATRTGCGTGQSVMGPFYCPADSTVYIDPVIL